MPALLVLIYQHIPLKRQMLAFYEELHALLNYVLEIDKIILLGNFNTRVGL